MDDGDLVKRTCARTYGERGGPAATANYARTYAAAPQRKSDVCCKGRSKQERKGAEESFKRRTTRNAYLVYSVVGASRGRMDASKDPTLYVVQIHQLCRVCTCWSLVDDWSFVRIQEDQARGEKARV
jgi:hypothetical protein